MESVPGRHRQEQRKREKGRKYHYIWERGTNFESRWGKEWVGKLEASGNRQICIRLKVTSTHVWKIITLVFPNDFNFTPCINYSSFPSEPPAEYKIYALFSNPFWLNVIFMRWWPTWVVPPSVLHAWLHLAFMITLWRKPSYKCQLKWRNSLQEFRWPLQLFLG